MKLNTHNLVHVVPHVKRHGPLRHYWLFFFENMQGVCSRFVQGPTHGSYSIAEMFRLSMDLPLLKLGLLSLLMKKKLFIL
jgi:hypothetical protein